MFQLFARRQEPTGMVIRPPTFEYLQRTYQREVEKVIEYFHTRVFATSSNHILCRLLTTGMVPASYDIDRLAEVASVRSPYVAKGFNFTSPINRGGRQHKAFYGNNFSEFVLSTESYFNPFTTLDDWKNITAVKVLYNPLSDLQLLLPQGEDIFIGNGVSVIQVDIPLLLFQYRGFQQQQALNIQKGSEQRLGIAHFVHMYVLPNMLKTQLDWALMNRVMDIHYGKPHTGTLKKLPFPIVDYGSKIDDMAEQVLKKIGNSRMWYSHMLQNIPSFYAANMQEFLQVPEMAVTRQVWWLLFMSRYKVMKFLIDVGGKDGVRSNRAYIGRLQLDLKVLLNGQFPRDLFSDDENHDFEDSAARIMRL